MLQELDSLKKGKGLSVSSVAHLAIPAISYILNSLKSREPRLWGQSMQQASQSNSEYTQCIKICWYYLMIKILTVSSFNLAIYDCFVYEHWILYLSNRCFFVLFLNVQLIALVIKGHSLGQIYGLVSVKDGCHHIYRLGFCNKSLCPTHWWPKDTCEALLILYCSRPMWTLGGSSAEPLCATFIIPLRSCM